MTRVSDKESAPLSMRLRERIRIEGAISFHDWMEAALYDEREGYYRREGVKRWGREGDYSTCPERSPLFAATFARLFGLLYEQLGKPGSFVIWESGGGAGHFARGVLETLARSCPEVFSATRYLFDEASAAARSQAQALLAPFDSHVEYVNPCESASVYDSCIVFANELLDAFPVHRVTLTEGRLRELFVDANDSGEFVWTQREPSTPLLSEYLEQANVELAEGQAAEINLHASEWLKMAAARFRLGYLILVDYGAEASDLYNAALRAQGSLRAFGRHRFMEDLLREPGTQDITTTVDWTTVKMACHEAGLEILSFERQDRFLLRAGLLEELARMSAEATDAAASQSLSASAREMILPGGMSESFQVMIARK
jgi:SAM-dependent MidA family methyltransferase